MLFTVLVALAVCELAMRTTTPSLSTDVAGIEDLPRMAKELHDQDGLRVLFLGNSLTGYGADTTAFEEEWRRHSITPIHCERASADGTNLTNWYYLFESHFADRGLPPDAVVIGFGIVHVGDDAQADPKQLGRSGIHLEHVPELFANDLTGFEVRSEFLLARILWLFGEQPRLKRKLLGWLLPYYPAGERAINAANYDGEDIPLAAAKNLKQTTYRRLQRMIDLLRASHVRGVFVAMPRRESYPLDDDIRRTIEEGGMTFVDLRSIPDLHPANFLDEMHLNAAGARIYSRTLARVLAERGTLTK